MPKLTISSGLVTVIPEPVSREEAIRLVSAPLVGRGLVEPSYPAALLEREKSFPTGLPTEGVGVAIPHTDCEHARAPALAVGILGRPVPFQNMADPDQAIDVQILFMLALDGPHSQVEMLQRVMELVQDAELLVTLARATSAEAAWVLLAPKFESLLA